MKYIVSGLAFLHLQKPNHGHVAADDEAEQQCQNRNTASSPGTDQCLVQLPADPALQLFVASGLKRHREWAVISNSRYSSVIRPSAQGGPHKILAC